LSGFLFATNRAFQLTVSNSAGVSTIIQVSTDLFNWVNIYTDTPPFTFVDPNATNYHLRFYRALVP
jgi:hypothetical protein